MNGTLRLRYEQVATTSAAAGAVDVARELVKVGTVTGKEANLAPLLADLLGSAGVEARVAEFAPGRTNVYGRLQGAGEGPTTLLVGHTDTVGVIGWPGAWGNDPRSDAWGATVLGESLWGIGSADDKGGIAAICAALAALRELHLRPAGDVVLAFVGDEESGQPGTGLSAGTKALVEELTSGRLGNPDFAIYVEPTSLDVYTAQPGFFIATITVRGRASYFAYPWQGRSAIRDATRVLEALEEHEAAIWGRGRHPSVGRPLLVVTGIRGGEAVAVPEHCEVDLIRTVPPGETLDAARLELEEILQRLALDRGIVCEASYLAPRDHTLGGTPVETDPEAPDVRLLHACATLAGRSAIGGAPYWSELPLLAAIGIRGVYFGPGDIAVCHTPLEHVPLADLRRATATIGTFLATRVTARPGTTPPLQQSPTEEDN